MPCPYNTRFLNMSLQFLVPSDEFRVLGSIGLSINFSCVTLCPLWFIVFLVSLAFLGVLCAFAVPMGVLAVQFLSSLAVQN
jgi:hypothetical protein